MKRTQPLIVSIKNASLICLSIIQDNNELEEHYYFCNDRGELLTENPYLSQVHYWFDGVRRSTKSYLDFYVEPKLPFRDVTLPSDLSSAVFLGGRMNWTHWNIDCLAPLLLLSPSPDESLITSSLASWQIDGLDFFGLKHLRRFQVSDGCGFAKYTFKNLRFVWNFDQIDRFNFLRHYISTRLPKPLPCESSTILSPTFASASPLRVTRISNPRELSLCLDDYSPTFIQPSSLSYSQKYSLYSSAKSILTFPGSDSINALLFGADDSKIIQMIPWPNNLLLLNKYSLLVSYGNWLFRPL